MVVDNSKIYGVSFQHVSVRDAERDHPAADLLLTEFDVEHFIAGETHFFKDEDVPVVFTEGRNIEQGEFGFDFNGLNIGGFGDFFIVDLEAEIVDIVL